MRSAFFLLALIYSTVGFAQAETTQVMLPGAGQGDFRFGLNFEDTSVEGQTGMHEMLFTYDIFYGLSEGHALTLGINHGSRDYDDIFDPITSTTIKSSASGPGSFHLGYKGRTDGQAASIYYGVEYYHPVEKAEYGDLDLQTNIAPRQPHLAFMLGAVLPTQSRINLGGLLTYNHKLAADVTRHPTAGGDYEASGMHEVITSVFAESEGRWRPGLSLTHIYVTKPKQKSAGGEVEGEPTKFLNVTGSLRTDLFSPSFQFFPSVGHEWFLDDDLDVSIWKISLGLRFLF